MIESFTRDRLLAFSTANYCIYIYMYYIYCTHVLRGCVIPEYRGCPCPLNACPKNVLIGPATGKAPAGGGPADAHALATPGGAFRAKVRACALDSAADTHGSGKVLYTLFYLLRPFHLLHIFYLLYLFCLIRLFSLFSLSKDRFKRRLKLLTNSKRTHRLFLSHL